MIIQVRVMHKDNDELKHVADVYAPKNDINHALDYAWRHTQNIEGSWSMGEYVNNNGVNLYNPDYCENVHVIEPLWVDKQGKEWGHRSSMIGDVFVIGETRYEVAPRGFERI